MEYRQVVSQYALAVLFGGSNPPTPVFLFLFKTDQEANTIHCMSTKPIVKTFTSTGSFFLWVVVFDGGSPYDLNGF